jgi:hypothetical protein
VRKIAPICRGTSSWVAYSAGGHVGPPLQFFGGSGYDSSTIKQAAQNKKALLDPRSKQCFWGLDLPFHLATPDGLRQFPGLLCIFG